MSNKETVEIVDLKLYLLRDSFHAFISKCEESIEAYLTKVVLQVTAFYIVFMIFLIALLLLFILKVYKSLEKAMINTNVLLRMLPSIDESEVAPEMMIE